MSQNTGDHNPLDMSSDLLNEVKTNLLDHGLSGDQPDRYDHETEVDGTDDTDVSTTITTTTTTTFTSSTSQATIRTPGNNRSLDNVHAFSPSGNVTRASTISYGSALAALGLSCSLPLSKQAQQLWNDYTKRVEMSSIQYLEDNQSDENFIKWLKDVEKLFCNVGLTALTYIKKSSRPLGEAKTQQLISLLESTPSTRTAYGHITSAISSGQQILLNNPDGYSPSTLHCVWLGTLHVFNGLELNIYNKLKSSVSIVFNHIFPQYEDQYYLYT